MKVTTFTVVFARPIPFGKTYGTVIFPVIKAANVASFRAADTFLNGFHANFTKFSIVFHNQHFSISQRFNLNQGRIMSQLDQMMYY